jgi:hypothetical protein
MKRTTITFLIGATVFSLALFSCGESEKGNEIDKEVFDPNSSLNTVFDGKIFSIPSPIQIAYLIKDLDLTYDGSILNDDKIATKYSTEHKQALNLGIYGTDLGYLTLYEQKSLSMNYLNSIEKLSSQLGLDAAFDSSFITRFESNNGNEDSMIFLMSDAFRKADNFLKNANRKSTSALILTGGWIESMFLACELNKKKDSDGIKTRIAEQKQTLSSIIDLLVEYNKGGSNDELIAQLEDLQVSFDKIAMTYEYEAPETDKDKKITTFNHKLKVEFSKEVLTEITTKLGAIRGSIIKV